MPCTINSGAVMAKQAGGNFAMALLLTVSSNVLGIFTSPVLLYLFADLGGVSFPVGTLLWKLGLTVFVPLVVGKLLRELPVGEFAIRKTVDANNKKITLLANFLLLMVPWMKFSNTVQSGALGQASPSAMLTVLLWTALMHLVFLGLNLAIGKAMGLSDPILKALVLVGSSKTLPMALTVLTFLGDFGGDPGLVALPCIIGHLEQIIFDGFLASWWAQRKNGSSGAESYTEMDERQGQAGGGGAGAGAGGEGGAADLAQVSVSDGAGAKAAT
ncbi:SBF-like CPA transporter family-domain-containing protein [Baffinella frigidus]|nr:SBF-like CPA transporter family-domain-containing protein [Cryptophyta sp. CCMP2293]